MRWSRKGKFYQVGKRQTIKVTQVVYLTVNIAIFDSLINKWISFGYITAKLIIAVSVIQAC
jgi:hypothetical protein